MHFKDGSKAEGSRNRHDPSEAKGGNSQRIGVQASRTLGSENHKQTWDFKNDDLLSLTAFRGATDANPENRTSHLTHLGRHLCNVKRRSERACAPHHYSYDYCIIIPTRREMQPLHPESGLQELHQTAGNFHAPSHKLTLSSIEVGRFLLLMLRPPAIPGGSTSEAEAKPLACYRCLRLLLVRGCCLRRSRPR